MTNKRGVTLIELLIVIVLIGVIAGFAFPRIGDAMTKQSVRSARAALVAMHAKTRAAAIQRGSRAQLILSSNRLTIQSINPVTGVTQTVGSVEDLHTRYGVTVSPSALTLTFDGRGVGMEGAQSSVSITKGTYTTTVVISSVGRVIQ